jgi:hypothetical protein
MSSPASHGPWRGRRATRRSKRPSVDQLESRTLLSMAPAVFHPTFEVSPLGGGPNPDFQPYTPAQIAKAYQFTSIAFGAIAGTGSGQVIAIVDAYDDPNIQSDLNTFDSQWGLPAASVIRVNQTGGTTYPAADPTGDWELEESLDVEWAHAMAPQATIMLVEANSAYGSDLLTAVTYAASHASVVSMSWGGSEWSGEAVYDSYFDQPGVAFVASSGDSGAPSGWPATSPNVLSVGGSALVLNSSNNWSSESGWSGSGGGPSLYESQPSYQTGVVTQTKTARAVPDVSYDASPATGVYVYDSIPFKGKTYGWLDVGGTSAGAPQWSAILAIADQGRALEGLAPLDSASPQEVMTILYANRGDFHDITTGTSDGSPSYSAGPGYDYVTGLGTPMANLIVGSLVSHGNRIPPTPSSDKLVLAAPVAVTAGVPFSLRVTAENSSGAADTGYLGTVAFASSDAQAGLPASFTFTAADRGSCSFTVTLKTAGGQSLTATDVANSAITGTLAGIAVSPAAASRFVVAGIPSITTPGVAQAFTVTAVDPYGNVATGYAGTVRFTSSDPAAKLPSIYTFVLTNQGESGFSMQFATSGIQSMTVTDVNSGITGSETGIAVGLAAPSNLVATAVSTSQINLSWTGSAGATGYLVQESLDPTSGWVQIGTTPAGTTSFQQTGLAAGLTYYYRVLATAGTYESAASNVASATTGATTASGDTIWSNSYVPSENVSEIGSFELGVKFMASMPGEVIGVRFYKETGMDGFVHVGHLWSSGGQLLASATFTGETASGWQQISFAAPVEIQAYTVYVVSFSTGGGGFGISTTYFNSGGVANGPLQALANGVPGGDGVYNRAGSFPNIDANGMNFWADLAFRPSYGGIITRVAPSSGSSNAASVIGPNLYSSTQLRLPINPAGFGTPRPALYFTAGWGTIPSEFFAWPNRPEARQKALPALRSTSTLSGG